MLTITRTWLIFIILGLPAFVLTNCGGGGGGDTGGTTQSKGSVKLTGTVDSTSGKGYQHKAGFKSLGIGAPLSAPGPNPAVDQVVAISMDRGSLSSRNMSSRVTSSIDLDGNFSLSLSKDHDWLLVLIDSSITGTQRYVGSVAVSAVTTTTSDGLLNLPTSVAAISSLNVGTVSRPTGTSNDALTSSAVTGTDFSMTVGQITTLAMTDGLLKNTKNIVNNYGNFGNPATTWYYLRPNLFWRRTYSGLTDTNNLVSQPVYTYARYGFQLDTNSTSVNMGMLCPVSGPSGTSTLQLFPPAGAIVTGGTATYTDTNPLQNDHPLCRPHSSGKGTEQFESPGDFVATDAYAKANQTMTYGFPTDLFGDIPPGYWTWMESGVVKGMFDASVSIPKTVAGNPKGFVPAMSVNVDGSNKILSVDIAWFYYDEAAGQYVKLLPGDLGILTHVMQSGEVEFVNEYYNVRSEAYFDPTVTTNIVPPLARDSNGTLINDGSWYFDTGAPNTSQTAASIVFFYETAGIGNYFEAYGLNSPGGGSGKPQGQWGR